MPQELAHILVGDHLGQVKKILIPSFEVSTLSGCAEPSSSNPVVSIQPIGDRNNQLIANKNGELYIYDPVHDVTKSCKVVDDSLLKALPLVKADKIVLIYDKHVIIEGQGEILKNKKGEIKNAIAHDNQLAYVGKDIPLKIFDIEKSSKIFEAEPPERDWLGIQPEVFVSGLDFVGKSKIVTCSKSDSVIRVYDPQCKSKQPVISANLNQEAFNEHAEAGRYISVASTGIDGRQIVVGSNVGQIVAIDLRFNVKTKPKKKLQPRTYKVIGSFKGARGASIKDVKIVPATAATNAITSEGGDSTNSYRVISCCLDRYLRVHNFTRNARQLERDVYMKTKPICCSPVYFPDSH